MSKTTKAARCWSAPQVRRLGTLSDVAGDAQNGNETGGCSLKKNGAVVCS